MPDVRKALSGMLKVANEAKKLDSVMAICGYNSTPYFTLYGDAADAINVLIGDESEIFEDTAAYKAVFSDEQWETRVDMLYNAYLTNHS